MTPRERVMAALRHERPDRVPRFEVWIDALYDELGLSDPYSAYAELGQDGILIPSQGPAGSNAWKYGTDEWGRVWKNGMYSHGVVDTTDDLVRYRTAPDYADQFFKPAAVQAVRSRFPDHCSFFGTHIGPFMNSYMAMGLDSFCMRIATDPPFIHALMESRTEWALAVYSRAVAMGAELIVMGDDAAHGGGPIVSPEMWREFVLPYHRRIVERLGVPVVWHSDGNIRKLLPMAVEAGFAGIHGLEPWSMSLAAIKAEFGDSLVLIGNADTRLLCGPDLDAVRREKRRCLDEGGIGAYMLSTCNSIFPGMDPEAVREFFRATPGSP
jgi:uroporphyrinogen decarboxylase